MRTEAPNIVIVDREGDRVYNLSCGSRLSGRLTVTYWNITGRNRIRYLWVDNVLFHSRRELCSHSDRGCGWRFGELMILWNFVRAEQTEEQRITALPGIRRASTSSRMDLRDALTWRRLFWRWRTHRRKRAGDVKPVRIVAVIMTSLQMRTRKLCGISGRRLNVIRAVILSIALDEERHPVTAADCASFLVTENGLPVTDQTGKLCTG